MTSVASVEQWKQEHGLVKCRWGCSITVDACRSYQARSARYVIHFNGAADPLPRVNAEYIRCVLPEACPHLLSDDEAHRAHERLRASGALRGDRRLQRAVIGRARNRLVNPDRMLNEPMWRRSLLHG